MSNLFFSDNAKELSITVMQTLVVSRMSSEILRNSLSVRCSRLKSSKMTDVT